MTVPAPAPPTGLTWEDFLALPDLPGYRHAELVDGRLVLDPASPLHQRVVLRMASSIEDWARAEPGRGEATMDPAVQVGARRGYLPDVAWYREEQCAPPDEPPAFSGPPTLAVEVLSPTTRAFDVLRKRADYARVGVGELWLIDPDGPGAQIYRRPAGAPATAEFVLAAELGPGDTLESPLLPGFTVALADLITR